MTSVGVYVYPNHILKRYPVLHNRRGCCRGSGGIESGGGVVMILATVLGVVVKRVLVVEGLMVLGVVWWRDYWLWIDGAGSGGRGGSAGSGLVVGGALLVVAEVSCWG